MEVDTASKEKILIEMNEMKKKIAKLEVTEDMHRWTEAKLQRENYKKAILLNNAPTMIYWLDSEGKFIIVNQCFADLFCKAPEEIEGKYLYDLFPEKIADKFFSDNMNVMEKEVPRYGIEELFKIKNGKTIWVKSDKIPYKDVDGKVIGIIGVLSENTKQIENNIKIRESEKLFRNIS